MAEPCPYVTLNVGQKTEESNVVQDSTDPRWEQGFRFLVHDPNFQTLDVEVTMFVLFGLLSGLQRRVHN